MSLQKVDIKIDVGERAIEYGAIAKKDGLDDMTIKVKRLVDKVGDIRSEQQYMRVRYWLGARQLLFASHVCSHSHVLFSCFHY